MVIANFGHGSCCLIETSKDLLETRHDYFYFSKYSVTNWIFVCVYSNGYYNNNNNNPT